MLEQLNHNKENINTIIDREVSPQNVSTYLFYFGFTTKLRLFSLLHNLPSRL